MRRTTSNRLSLALLAGLAAAGLGACSGSPRHAGDEARLRARPSPELHTQALNEQQALNRDAIARDQNLKMMIDDLSRTVLYNDRPSRLTPTPMAY